MKVVCIINPKNKYSLTIGKEYNVISFENGKYQLKNDKGHIFSFNQWFFKSDAEIKIKMRNDKLDLLLT
jgi:hypothetical protein